MPDEIHHQGNVRVQNDLIEDTVRSNDLGLGALSDRKTRNENSEVVEGLSSEDAEEEDDDDDSDNESEDDDESDDDETSSNDSSIVPAEPLATTRSRRSNAGNRLESLIEKERQDRLNRLNRIGTNDQGVVDYDEEDDEEEDEDVNIEGIADDGDISMSDSASYSSDEGDDAKGGDDKTAQEPDYDEGASKRVSLRSKSRDKNQMPISNVALRRAQAAKRLEKKRLQQDLLQQDLDGTESSSIDTTARRSSLRPQTIKAKQEAKEREEERRKRRREALLSAAKSSLASEPKKAKTHEERLIEAERVEKENSLSLQQFLDVELQQKKLREKLISKRRQISGPIMRLKSSSTETGGATTISLINMTHSVSDTDLASIVFGYDPNSK